MSGRFVWPAGRSCAVSLTYDDGLAVHPSYVAPALEARGLRGTFYALITGDPLVNFESWRKMAAAGHELGNHSLFHPCRRDHPGMYPWLDNGFDLRTYTPYRFLQELRVANTFLHLLDGQHARTYGATCCDLHLGTDRQSIEELLRKEKDFIAIRGRQRCGGTDVTTDLNLMNVPYTSADGRAFEDLRAETRKAAREGTWLVYGIHGVGLNTHEHYIERDVHERLLDYLAGDTTLWVQPFVSVAQWILQWRR